MKLDIRGRNMELPDALRAHTQRRLQFALSRFGQRIRQVVVSLTDLKSPRNGVNKQCRITVDMTPSGRLIAQASDVDSYAAIDWAVDQMERRIAHELKRRREA